jgi:RNA polymerase sigma-70 factor, ECF subfamily
LVCHFTALTEPQMSPIETRHSLIVRLKSGQNEIAWRDFVGRYEGFLIRIARRQGVPERHVADVTQQILMAIVRSIEGWKDDGNTASFRRWLSTVSRNVVIRFMTQNRRQPGGVGGSDLVALLHKVEEKPDEAHIQRYQHELIVWAAEQVRREFLETSWQAFWATVIEQRSVDQVAKDLNISTGSIYMSRSRIMAKIRKIVATVQENE